MSNRIELTLSPSMVTGLLATLPWLVLVGFLMVAATSGKPWLLTGLPVALAGAAFQFRHNGLLRGDSTVTALRLEDGELSAQLRDNRRIPVVVSVTSRVGSRLALLKLRPIGTRFRSHSAILLATSARIRGNVPEDEFRRLRVWLRLGRSETTPG